MTSMWSLTNPIGTTATPGTPSAATPGTDPQFVSMLRDLVVERAAAERGEEPARPCVGRLGPAWDDCRHDCCPPLRRPTAKEAV